MAVEMSSMGQVKCLDLKKKVRYLYLEIKEPLSLWSVKFHSPWRQISHWDLPKSELAEFGPVTQLAQCVSVIALCGKVLVVGRLQGWLL